MEDKLPRLKQLKLKLEPDEDEAVTLLLHALEQGKLKGLERLQLSTSESSSAEMRFITALLEKLEGGMLPDLRELRITIVGEGELVGVGQAIGSGMARGAMARLEELHLDWNHALGNDIITGLREGRFDRLARLTLRGASGSGDANLLAEVLAAFYRTRFPRLRVLELGDCFRKVDQATKEILVEWLRAQDRMGRLQVKFW